MRSSFSVLIGIFVSVFALTQCNSGPELISEGNRMLRSAAFEYVSLSSDFSDSLYRPSSFIADYNAIYVYDSGRHRYLRFTRDGDFLNFIGDGEGRGPNEFSQSGTFAVKNDTLYALDNALLRLSAFTTSGKFLYTFPIENLYNSVARVGNLIYVKYDSRHPQIVAYRENGEIAHELIDTFKDVDNWIASTTGRLFSWGDLLVFAPNLSSIVQRFHGNGVVADSIHLPDNIPFQPTITIELAIRERTVKVMPPPSMLPNYGAKALFGDTLAVYTNIASSIKPGNNMPDVREGPFTYYLDFLSLSTGDYMFSVKMDSTTTPLKNVRALGHGNLIIGDNVDDEPEIWRYTLQ